MKKIVEKRKGPEDKSFSEPMHIKRVAKEKRAHELNEDKQDKLEKEQVHVIIY